MSAPVRPLPRLAPAAAIDRQWAAIALVLAVATVVNGLAPTATDVSWLVVTAGRLLDGERLYVDVLEVNPPGSVLLYLPAVLLERWSGLRAETGVLAITILAGAASTAFAGSILARAGLGRRAAGTALALLVVLLLPLATFAQREHFTLLGLLPILALIAARTAGAPIPFGTAVATGIAAGLAMAIKPTFALAILAPAIGAAVALRAPRAMVRTEYVVAALVVIAYGVVTLAFFPAYRSEMLPLVSGSYLDQRIAVRDFIEAPQMRATFALLAIGLAADWRAGHGPVGTTLALAAVGAWGAAVLQGKGWPYHLMPFVLLATLAALSGLGRLAGRPRSRWAAIAGTVLAAVLLLPLLPWLNARPFDYPALAAAFGPELAGRTVVVVSHDLAVGHPLSRMTGARFVGRNPSAWMTDTSGYLTLDAADPEYREASAWAARDRVILAADIRDKRPDAILVDQRGYDWGAFLRADAALGDLLAGYHRAARAQDIDLWRRDDGTR